MFFGVLLTVLIVLMAIAIVVAVVGFVFVLARRKKVVTPEAKQAPAQANTETVSTANPSADSNEKPTP